MKKNNLAKIAYMIVIVSGVLLYSSPSEAAKKKKHVVVKTVKAGEKGRIRLTTFCANCDKSGTTASQREPRVNRTLAAGYAWPIGTVVYIEGLGNRVVEDRGGAVHHHFDVFVKRCPIDCWTGPGIQPANRNYKVISVPKPKPKKGGKHHR